MSEPIIFTAHQKIKPGKAEEYKKVYQETGRDKLPSHPPPLTQAVSRLRAKHKCSKDYRENRINI